MQMVQCLAHAAQVAWRVKHTASMFSMASYKRHQLCARNAAQSGCHCARRLSWKLCFKQEQGPNELE